MLDDHADRLLREFAGDVGELAHELYTLLTSHVLARHFGNVEFNNTTTDPSLTLRNYSDAQVMVKLDGMDGVQTLSTFYAVPIFGEVLENLGSNSYSVALTEYGEDEDVTATVTATRMTPPATTHAVGDRVVVYRLPDGFDDDGEPVFDYRILGA